MSPGVWDVGKWKLNEECKARIQGVLCGQLKLCFPLSSSSLAHFSLSLSSPRSGTRVLKDSTPDFPYCLLPRPIPHQGLRAELLEHQVAEAQGPPERGLAICPASGLQLHEHLI